MEITRTRPDTERGPEQWFTGAVYIDPIALPDGDSRLRALSVHFSPGARTAWHTHPIGQVLYVVEGVGRAARRGGPVETIRAGDTVRFAPGEEHWHGAAPGSFMTHLALQQTAEDGTHADWLEHVTDADYGG
jgi:quercetin dioxygenase-like cupin family protein